MIDNRHSCFLACAIACACSSSAGQSQPRDARDEAVASAAFDAEPTATPETSALAAANPYAATRLSPLNSYGWQNPKRPPCGKPVGSPNRDETYTAPVKLSFSGSIASFPLLPEDDPNAIQPKREADERPLDTWGEGPLADATSTRRDPDFVVASLRPRLRSCFASWLDRRAEAEGSIRFALELGCAGEVQTISAKAEGVDESTVQCLFAVVAPATFAPPAGGHATIHVPVVFKNAGR